MNTLLDDGTPPARPAQPGRRGVAVTPLHLRGEITVTGTLSPFAKIEAARDLTIYSEIDSP